MTPLPRTAISLYVALAVHALVLLAMALGAPSQSSSGSGRGLSVRGAALSPEQHRLVANRETRPMAAPADTTPPLKPDVPPSPVRRLTSSVDRTAVPAAAPGAPTPGIAQTGGGGRDLYFARLRAHLAGFGRELRPGLPAARSHVQVAIAADGGIEALELHRSSGVPELDAEAMDLVRRAAPLPAPPRGRAIRLIVPVEIVPARPG